MKNARTKGDEETVDAVLFKPEGLDATSGVSIGPVFLRRDGDTRPYFLSGGPGTEHDPVTLTEAERLAAIENLPLFEI